MPLCFVYKDRHSNLCGEKFTYPRSARTPAVSNAASVIPTWGDFNSLIQLSIGLNAAFATFSDFLGDGLSQEEKRAGSLIKSIEKIHKDASPKQYPPDVAKDWLDLQLIVGECQDEISAHGRFRSGFVRISGFICAFIGFIALGYASYNAAAEISYYEQAIIFIMMLPFLFGASRGMYKSIRSRSKISNARQAIEERIRTRQRIITSQKKAELDKVQIQTSKVAVVVPATENIVESGNASR